MSIMITVSQRCGGEFGQPVYFAKDCDAAFTLDGNADNAQMMAGYAIEGIIKAHRGDTLLIVVRLHGRLAARHVGVATDDLAAEMSRFVSSGWLRDWACSARRLAA